MAPGSPGSLDALLSLRSQAPILPSGAGELHRTGWQILLLGTYNSCPQQHDWHIEELMPWRREAARTRRCISYKHRCLLFLQIIGYRPGAGVPVSVDCKVQVLLPFVLRSVVCRKPNVSL